MKNDTINVLCIKDLQGLIPKSFGNLLSDDFFLATLSYSDSPELVDILKRPYHLDGYVVICCFEGELEVEINQKPYLLKKGSVIFNIPGNMWRVHSAAPEQRDELRFAIIAVSRDFMSVSRMDYVRLYRQNLSAFDNPCFQISESEQTILNQYHHLVLSLSTEKSGSNRQTIWGLVASCLYYLGTIWTRRISISDEYHFSRHRLLLEQFLDLVSEHHDKEHGMAFYAGKLCLTPKYLSGIIKNVSGRSGPEWIDSFILLEAKNMLKYTDMPIKQIVSRLHFPKPSGFYRFFKAHTGRTPSEYRG